MNQKTICINDLGRAAYGRKVETSFPFLYEVLHFTPTTVKLKHLVRIRLHSGHKKREHMTYTSVWFLDLKYDPSWMRPASSLIHELTIHMSFLHLILNGSIV